MLMALIGFALIICTHFHFVPSSWPIADSWVTATGGFIIASSYFWNWRLRKVCKAKA